MSRDPIERMKEAADYMGDRDGYLRLRDAAARFEVGDGAQLMPGLGPAMTVVGIDGDMIDLVWFAAERKLERATLPRMALILLDELEDIEEKWR